jgi:hypothetical protein
MKYSKPRAERTTVRAIMAVPAISCPQLDECVEPH